MEQPAVKRHSRIDVADVLRGFAVMGIVLLHTIEHYNFYSFPDTSQQCTLLNFTDKAIWDGLFFTFGGKAYAIFALLFGFSFFIQDDNQRLQGRDFRLRFCWRLVLLFVLGNINAIFFTAEVLVLFSLVGFVLVATCRMSDRAVFIIATVCLLQPLHWIYLILAAADPAFTLPNIPTAELWSATTAAQNQTSFLEMVRVNLVQGQLASLAWAWDNARFFQTAALFMYGMLIGRRGAPAESRAECDNGKQRAEFHGFFSFPPNQVPNGASNAGIILWIKASDARFQRPGLLGFLVFLHLHKNSLLLVEPNFHPALDFIGTLFGGDQFVDVVLV